VLWGIFTLIEDGVIKLSTPVPVRNCFRSVINNEPFEVDASRDTCAELYSSIGKSLPVSELAFHMIVTSSNLATNLLVDLAGINVLQKKIGRLKIKGIGLQRGVEDDRAYEQNIINTVTANGLLALFRNLHEANEISIESREKMLSILKQQKFNDGIPAGIPDSVRQKSVVAHKTGEISTVTHDSGLIFLPGREPYALVILTEHNPNKNDSNVAIQKISELVYITFIDSEITEETGCSRN